MSILFSEYQSHIHVLISRFGNWNNATSISSVMLSIAYTEYVTYLVESTWYKIRWILFQVSYGTTNVSDDKQRLFSSIWIRSRNCGSLVTWFCYQLIAKPGNKTATVLWLDPKWYSSSAILKDSVWYDNWNTLQNFHYYFSWWYFANKSHPINQVQLFILFPHNR